MSAEGPFEQINIHDTAKTFGTPCYIYDWTFIEKRIRRISSILEPDIKLYYAVKANPCGYLLKLMSNIISGVDLSSGGELRKTLEAGFSPSQMSFAGPGKSPAELRLAVEKEIGIINVESLEELKRIDAAARQIGKRSNVALRVNPSKIFRGFAIKMGGRPSQFGIDEEQTDAFFKVLSDSTACRFTGIHVYSGTQCLDEESLIDNYRNTLEMALRISVSSGVPMKTINFGGGWGVPYFEGQKSIDESRVCNELKKLFCIFKKEPALKQTTGIIELGRYLTAEAGIYAAEVIDIKESRGKKYAVLNGGMHHHLPASGNFGQVIRKNYKISNVTKIDFPLVQEMSLVGPLCTTIDLMGDRVKMPVTEIGDVIVFHYSGAYAYTASPLQFLSHPSPKELFFSGSEVKCITESFAT